MTAQDPQDAPQAPPWIDKDAWQEELDAREPVERLVDLTQLPSYRVVRQRRCV